MGRSLVANIAEDPGVLGLEAAHIKAKGTAARGEEGDRIEKKKENREENRVAAEGFAGVNNERKRKEKNGRGDRLKNRGKI